MRISLLAAALLAVLVWILRQLARRLIRILAGLIGLIALLIVLTRLLADYRDLAGSYPRVSNDTPSANAYQDQSAVIGPLSDLSSDRRSPIPTIGNPVIWRTSVESKLDGRSKWL